MEVFEFEASQNVQIDMAFQTIVLEDSEGFENRIPNWNSPILNFDLSKALSYSQHKDSLREFFVLMKGQTESFLYIDPIDNEATAIELLNPYGSKTQGILYPEPDGVRTEFQLVKVYKVGTSVHYRPITNPIKESIEIYTGEFIAPSALWLEQKGKITFAAPPSSTITANFKFYVPVRFSQPTINWSLDRDEEVKGNQVYQLENFTLEEVREDCFDCPIDIFGDLDNFALDGWINSTTGVTDKTEIINMFSGYDFRKTRYKFPKAVFNLDRIKLDDFAKDYLIAFWRCAKGKALAFEVDDRSYHVFNPDSPETIAVRFDDDVLSIGCIRKGLYESSNIKLREAYKLFFDNQTYVRASVDVSGSMNSDIPIVEKAIAQLREFLKINVYGTEQVTNKYVKPINYFPHEQWAYVITEDLRDDPGEPNKQVHLIWLNEAQPFYHDPDDPNFVQPSEDYLAQSGYFVEYTAPLQEKFKAIIYSVYNQSPIWKDIVEDFDEHLINAANGTNGYPVAMKDYGVVIRTKVEPNKSPSYYFNDIINA